MKTPFAMFIGLVVPILLSVHSAAQEPAAEEEYQSVFFSTGAHDPREIASVMDRLFAKRLTITPLIEHSAVVIRTSERDREEVMSVLKTLTPEPHMLRLRLALLRVNTPLSAEETARLSGPIAQVSKALDNLKKSGRLEFFNDAELTTLENQKAMIQMGDRVALPTGSTQIAGGRTTESFQWVEVGTIVSVVGKPDNQHLILELNYEKSFKPLGDRGSESGKVPTGISTLTHQSTLRIQNGHAQLVGSMSDRKAEDQTVVHLLIVSAEQL